MILLLGKILTCNEVFWTFFDTFYSIFWLYLVKFSVFLGASIKKVIMRKLFWILFLTFLSREAETLDQDWPKFVEMDEKMINEVVKHIFTVTKIVIKS